ncbi:MAG: radical SAM protein [Candidatus Omnitrophota bacterium]
MNIKYDFRNEREKNFPLMLNLEITNICNYQCIHCPYPSISQRKDYTPKFMSWEIFKKIADQTANYPETIFRFVCDGEPMMHPDFLRMVEYVKNLKISPVCFTTNGYFLTPEVSRKIVEFGCDLIEISLDAFSEYSYNKIRRGGNYHKVIDNLNYLIQSKNELSAKSSKIMVSIIDQPLVKNEITTFKNFWQDKVDYVITRVLTSAGGFIKESIRDNKTDVEIRWPCPLLWRRLFINVDGWAEYCVDDWLDQSILGDVNKESIASIWGGQKYRDLRKNHINNNFSYNEKCAQCQDWRARTWENDYFHAIERIFNLNFKNENY